MSRTPEWDDEQREFAIDRSLNALDREQNTVERLRRERDEALEDVGRLRAELAACDEALKKAPFFGQEELSETSVSSAIANYRNAVEDTVASLRTENERLQKEWEKERDEARELLSEIEYTCHDRGRRVLLAQADRDRKAETLRRVVKAARRCALLKRDWRRCAKHWGTLAETLDEEIADLRAELAACAAGPWHPASEEPPRDEDVYLVQYPDLRTRGRYYSEVVMWHRGDGWEGDKRFPPALWAEIREPGGESDE